MLTALMAAAIVAISSAFSPQAMAKTFSDVSGGSWYSGYVGWVSDEGVMTGYPDGRFGPSDTLTRGMVATVLYRAATGATASDANGTQSPFADVPGGKWYTSGVAWAKANGVVTGYGGTSNFGPDDPVTREQMATMCARYAAYVQGRDATGGSLSGHPDAGLVSSWASSSVAWCGVAGIMSGDAGSGALRPQDGCTRAEAAKMFTVLLGGSVGLSQAASPFVGSWKVVAVDCDAPNDDQDMDRYTMSLAELGGFFAWNNLLEDGTYENGTSENGAVTVLTRGTWEQTGESQAVVHGGRVDRALRIVDGELEIRFDEDDVSGVFICEKVA